MKEHIKIKNARLHNLKGIDVSIPKQKLTVITGVSGSGKSTLAFDTLYEEGRRRYLMFSGTQFMVESEPAFDSITGLSPTVAVEQCLIRQSNPRSTVGTRIKIGTMLAALFAGFGVCDPAYDDGIPLDVSCFQKNSAKGMCVKCLGKGTAACIDEEGLFADKNQHIYEVACELGKRGSTRHMLEEFCNAHGINLLVNGVVSTSGRLAYLLTNAGMLERKKCPKCGGTGLGEKASHTTFGGKNITELEEMYISDLLAFLKYVRDMEAAEPVRKSSSAQSVKPGGSTPLLNEIITKLQCMVDVGLHHLSLSRPVPTLSGGEIQRLFLASYMISEMDSIIFVFDEPTIGLHETEKQNLIRIIKKLVSSGNTVVAVEHDENFMREADYIIDMGPLAGIHGGMKIYEGGYREFLNCAESKTSPYLSPDFGFPVKKAYRLVDMKKCLTISGGESQRIKLAKELAKGKNVKGKSTKGTEAQEENAQNVNVGKTLYILDEPTTGLSFYDTERLMELLNELVDNGNSIIVTEHDPYVLSNCDYILEMGPGGGKDGGILIAQGTPAELKEDRESVIGRYLR